MSLTYQLGEKFHIPFQARLGGENRPHRGPSGQTIRAEYLRGVYHFRSENQITQCHKIRNLR